MAKSAFERFARGLGRLTGHLLDKAHEAGLDKKAGELAHAAKERVQRLVDEAKKGAEEARAESEGKEEEGQAEGEAESHEGEMP
jgi:hypothetical protein